MMTPETDQLRDAITAKLLTCDAPYSTARRWAGAIADLFFVDGYEVRNGEKVPLYRLRPGGEVNQPTTAAEAAEGDTNNVR